VLPHPTPVNANTASETLLAILLNDAITARALVEQREKAGSLLPEDLAGKTDLSEDSIGFTSAYFWVRTRVTIGDTRQQLTSLLARERREGRPVSVAVSRRWWGGSGPPEAPRLP
jgi:type II secretory pathway component PulK